MKKNKLEIGDFSINKMGRSQIINVKGGGGDGSEDPPPITGDPLTGSGTGGGTMPGGPIVTFPFIPFPGTSTEPPKPPKPTNT